MANQFCHESNAWSVIQEQASLAVVWIIAQIKEFNWLEPQGEGEQYESRGTGFFINQDGYILTTLHIVNNAISIWIVIPHISKKNLKASLVSLCPERDLALLKLDDDELTYIKQFVLQIPALVFGNSDAVSRAESVLLLSYPLGQGHLKGTTGVISGREWLQGQLMLQMTAPVNQGSSGGPVISCDGRVVGITIAMDVHAQNVGYAIPINEFLYLFEEMSQKKRAQKPVFGARFIWSDDEKAAYLGNPQPGGLYITAVTPGGIFARAGIQTGDMLYQFGPYVLDAYGDAQVPWSQERVSLAELVSKAIAGQEVPCVIYRNGEKKEVLCQVTGDNPYVICRKYPMVEPIEYEVIGGIVLMELTENHIEALLADAPHLVIFTTPEKKIERVVIVTAIEIGSYAYQFRALKPGDIVHAINGISVSSIQECKIAAQKGDKNYISILVQNGVLAVFSLKKLTQWSDQAGQVTTQS